MELKDGAELCFPQLFNISCRKPTLHWSETVLLNILLVFISLITVVLNLLVIISVSHFRQLHTPTNILLLSLAVSDFLVGLLLMPLEIFKKSACWILGDVVCVLYGYLVSHIVCASIGNIVLISVDRYVAICHPLHYPIKITVTRVKCCVCLSWLWFGFFTIVYLKDELIEPGRNNSCFGECTLFISYVARAADLVLTFIIPVSVIVFVYVRVFAVAVSHAVAMRSHITDVTFQHSVNVTKKSELKAARTLAVLVIVYLICFCPFYCYSLVTVDLTGTSYASFLFFLFYFNSCLNPIIYALFYHWFRKAVKLIVTLQILQPCSCEANIM
ncbi:trace amine-associated receptor 13c-like [Melanotaenia boesemani]|uniref:trace amine-associated receptor 13c-like n=1 Tax=Melanotaenia boesemani TaxID=1250792 RepID=UPI001C04DDF1|nr:trace amine-associated receptor 13c-like [Melanotaenia boesemani]